MTSSISPQEHLIQLFTSMPDASTNILTALKGNRLWITFNRPKRYNAFASDMYPKFTKLINEASNDDKVKFIIVTGSGGNFSSGNDLNNFSISMQSSLSPEHRAKISVQVLEDLGVALINSKKPIFAIIEGKAIGFAFTQLALYDKVFAVEGSEFNAPLVKIAQGPEMCSSFTFPKFFGQRLGQELIVHGTKVNSTFLKNYDFVTECKSRTEAERLLEQHLNNLDALDWKSYLQARKLFHDTDREQLLKVNKKETQNLYERWINPDLVPYLMNYMKKVKTNPKL